MTGRPKVVVLGLMSTMPVAGVVWQTLHYLLGLELLGAEAYYVESHARTPSALMTSAADDGAAKAAAFVSSVMHRFGFDRRWAFHALHDDGRCFGMSHAELLRLYADAACIVNLHGGTQPLPEHAAGGRLLYVETDPVLLQLELAAGQADTIEFLDAHCAHFTFAENWGRPDCRLPVTDRYSFRPTRQPVVLDLWATAGPAPGTARATTVANWDQQWRDVRFEGTLYRWNKREEFLKLLDLPFRVPLVLELCLDKCGADDRRLLESYGWAVRDAVPVSGSIDEYRRYVRASAAEFTVAKDQNVRLRSGWFSDRSATYLAAGRPVVTQDTGFGAALPTGAGLYAFGGVEEAAEALGRVAADPAGQSAAAREVARAFFSHDVVLRPMLEAVGVELAARRPGPGAGVARDRTAAPQALPAHLVLEPVSKHPLRLAPDTEAHVRGAPVVGTGALEHAGEPETSIVVVVHDSPLCTRLCLQSVLENTGGSDWELVVVDNGSAEETSGLLEALAATEPRVRLLRNEDNAGFPAAVNRGLTESLGSLLVVLNSDTIVTPGWLSVLARHAAHPAVGMVGPVTNEAPGPSRVRTGYRTYGEMLAFAAGRPAGVAGRDVEMLPMFCVALRRDVLEHVGLLDEGFGTGLFEDDDYAMRLRRAGYRLVCAEDAFVHHFGRGSFGALVASGRHGELFERNKARFEERWGVTWRQQAGRDDAHYGELVERVRSAVLATVPAGAGVAVCSRGDEHLLALPGRRAVHFPAAPDGTWAGCYPADDEDAVAQVESLRLTGCDYVVFPATATWWLERYPGLHEHLRRTTRVVDLGRPDCVIFRLDEHQGEPS